MPLNVACETHAIPEPFNRDVCRILGFNNPKDALTKKVKKAYKTSLGALCEMHVEDDLYSENRVAYVSQPGLHLLIFSSRLELADLVEFLSHP